MESLSSVMGSITTQPQKPLLFNAGLFCFYLFSVMGVVVEKLQKKLKTIGRVSLTRELPHDQSQKRDGFNNRKTNK